MSGDAPSPTSGAKAAARDVGLDDAFPPVDLDLWRAKARAALAVADDAGLEAALVRRTRDGLVRGPLMTREDRPVPSPAPLWRAGGALDNRVAVRASDPAAANALALEALEGGATSIALQLGRSLATLDALDRALDGVVLEAAPVSLAGADAAAAALLPELWARRGLSPASAGGALNIDPLGRRAAGAKVETEAELDAAAALASTLADAGSPATTLRIDARPVHEAGGSEAAELGWAAACGAAYLEALVRRGLEVDAASRAIGFAVALDADMHLGIAKLRALRRLWSRIAEAAGAGSPSAVVEAFSSNRMLKIADPPTNLLRQTAAAMAAALGGADSVTLDPYDAADPTRARRLARNIPLLVAEEARLGEAADPAQGSFHHEAMTEALAAAAWTRFQAVMRSGGPAAFLASGRRPAEIGA